MPSLPGSVRWRLAYLSWVLLSGRHSRTFGAPSLLLKSQWNRQRSKSLWPVWLVLHWWVWSLCKLQPGRSFGRLQASYACQAVYLCHCCLHGGSFPGLQASRGHFQSGHFQSCNLQVEAAIQRRAWQQNQRGPQGEHEPATHSFAGSRRRGREFSHWTTWQRCSRLGFCVLRLHDVFNSCVGRLCPYIAWRVSYKLLEALFCFLFLRLFGMSVLRYGETEMFLTKDKAVLFCLSFLHIFLRLRVFRRNVLGWL